MTSAADLFGLQEIDLSRDSRRALIADIESRMGETDEIIAAREAVEEWNAELKRLQREQRDLDARSKDLDAKINPLEAKLYGGSIRNPKELTDLQHEVEGLKVHRRELDDEELKLIDDLETAAKRLQDAQRTLTTIQAAWESAIVELRETKERAEREMARLDEERSRRTVGMNTASLGMYEKLRTVKAGKAVARIERGSCQGCRIGLPTHIVQRARSESALVQCPSCERILVGG